MLSQCSGEGDEQWRRAMEYVSQISELNYMSQVVIMLYEDPNKDPSSEQRLSFSCTFASQINTFLYFHVGFTLNFIFHLA